MNYLLLILTFLMTLSCSGYRLNQNSNPFAQYGIKSLSIPMFYNKSNLPNVSGVFTQEIFGQLSKFKKLKLVSGKSYSTDAFLIGIVESSDKRNSTVFTTSSRSAESTFKNAVGSTREDFKVPTSNKIGLSVRLIIIKHPTKAEVDFFREEITRDAISSKVIFNEVIGVSTSYTLKSLGTEGTDVIGTQNRGTRRAAVKTLAIDAGNSFKDMIIYAF